MFSVHYLAVDRAFPYHLNIFNNFNANHSSPLVNITIGTGIRTFTSTIDYTALATAVGSSYTSLNPLLTENKIVPYLNGLFTAAQDDNTRYNFNV